MSESENSVHTRVRLAANRILKDRFCFRCGQYRNGELGAMFKGRWRCNPCRLNTAPSFISKQKTNANGSNK